MGHLLRHVRETPERLLHPIRRRKALERLRARARPKLVLVVCHGNICRSPVAGALLARELAPLGIGVKSAGLIGFNRPAPDHAIAAALRYQVDLAAHRSRPVTAALARAADLIVVMEQTQRRHFCERFGRAAQDVIILGDFDPFAVETRSVRDPLDQTREVFDEVYERIARCTRALGEAFSPES